MSVLTPLGKIALTPRGPYDAQTDYERLDVVLLSGSSYVCVDPSRGESPDQSAKWRLLAAGGEGSGSGVPGPTGPAGPAGPEGPAGEDGATFTPSVDEEGNLSWTNDKELPNPPTVNIKGKDGKDGKDGTGASVTLSDADPQPPAAQASAGNSEEVSRADHVHQEQTDVTGNAGTASRLKTARTFPAVDLASTESASFDGSADPTALGVTGTLPVDHGGTGATTAEGARAALGLTFTLDGTTLRITVQ